MQYLSLRTAVLSALKFCLVLNATQLNSIDVVLEIMVNILTFTDAQLRTCRSTECENWSEKSKHADK